MVPHLVTALTGPINELEQRVLDTMPAIERWFRLEWMEHTPPFYTSVDVRNAGFKLAPVDTDFYPAGWNNLTPEMLPLAVQAAMVAIEKICPEARNLLIIPDNQIQSTFYLSNLTQLRRIFQMAGLNVRMGSINPALKKSTTMELPGGESITVEPVVRTQGRISVKDFDPCTILLNNDLSAGDMKRHKLTEIMGNLDLLLGAQPMTLSTWIASASDYGDSLSEKTYYVRNAKAQVTYWGGSGNAAAIR